MKRPSGHKIAGSVLVIAGILLLVTIRVFLTGEERGADVYKTRVAPETARREAQLNITDIPEPERTAMSKLNQWIVFEKSGRIEWAVACAFFSVALTLVLTGIIVILTGRIRALEKQIEKTQPQPGPYR